ncbi:MAG: N-6 DNA methylase, partial [Spirochaetes bacterium]|nr:N-6 DNA methylase [Spirochaetota bacterium]
GGVYYTPRYIVDYIVKNTVGEKIKDKSPEYISGENNGLKPLAILDPACGSGSFLVGAYEYLLKYHLDYYTNQKHIKNALKSGKIYHVSENTYYLSIEEKQNILLNNIYGVDIDNQAVEVTKLSLLLKLMEGENIESQGQLFKYSDHKLLPDLSNNIKCGNSLIGSDFYKDKNLSLFEDEEMRKINVFDWEKEFKEIFTAENAEGAESGFDVVIGNPPYGAVISDDEKQHLIKHYKSYEYQLNSFSFFIEKSGKILKENGYLSFITPAVFLSQHYFMNLRNNILNTFKIEKIIVLNYKVFQDAETGDTSVFVFNKINSINKLQKIIIEYKILDNNDFPKDYKKTNQEYFYKNERLEFNIFKNNSIFKKVYELSIRLEDISNCIMGIKPYQTGKGRPKQTKNTVKDRIYDSKNKIGELYKKYLIGKDIDRYIIKPIKEKYIKYGEWLAEPRFAAPFEKTKIILRQTSDKIRAVLDFDNYYNLNNIYNIEITDESFDYKYILGILNSKLMIYIYQM